MSFAWAGLLSSHRRTNTAVCRGRELSCSVPVVDDVAEQRRRVLGDRHSQVVDPVGRVQEIEEEVQVLGTHGTGEYSCEETLGDGNEDRKRSKGRHNYAWEDE